jgi:hypothetical protein
MWTNPDWRAMTSAEEAKRLEWLRKQLRRGKTSFTLEDLTLLMVDDISRWSPDQRAHARAHLNRALGLAKESEGKPS